MTEDVKGFLWSQFAPKLCVALGYKPNEIIRRIQIDIQPGKLPELTVTREFGEDPVIDVFTAADWKKQESNG